MNGCIKLWFNVCDLWWWLKYGLIKVMKYELIMGVMGLNEEVWRFDWRCSSMFSRAKLSEYSLKAARPSELLGGSSEQTEYF